MFSKKFLLVAATAGMTLFGATATFADEITIAPEIDNFKSTKTRAEVVAETAAASSAGLIARNDSDVERIAGLGFRSTKSRAQVVAETIEAKRLGLTGHGEIGVPDATPLQLEAIRMAGERALMSQNQVALN